MALRRSTRSVRQLSTTIVQNGDLNNLKSTEFTSEASQRRSSNRKGKQKEQPAKSGGVHTNEPIHTSEDVAAGEAVSIKSRRKTNKIKEEPKPDDYVQRIDNEWKVGAHVSAAGGVENAVLNAAAIGANAFALFVKSQRKWASPSLTDESIRLFRQRMESFGYSPRHVLPHGSYLINLGNPDSEKREKSYNCFLDDLKRCEQLGLLLYNFHPGSTVGEATPEASISFIAECLNRAHKATSSVITVIENMSGAGNIIGSSFAQLASIIDLVTDKSRVGVCLDTCHMFAAGYDIKSKDAYISIMEDFDREVGLKYLRGMHLNDSKTPLGSHKDRHENIGRGFLGIAPFSHLLQDPRLKDLPLILETPTFERSEVWSKEIDLLNRLGSADETLWSKATEELAAVLKDVGKEVKKASTKRKRADSSNEEF